MRQLTAPQILIDLRQRVAAAFNDEKIFRHFSVPTPPPPSPQSSSLSVSRIDRHGLSDGFSHDSVLFSISIPCHRLVSSRKSIFFVSFLRSDILVQVTIDAKLINQYLRALIIVTSYSHGSDTFLLPSHASTWQRHIN
jgi:hypothetical protein